MRMTFPQIILSRFNQGCISATSVKLIAVLLMSLDHLGAYGFVFPIIARYTDELRLLGRMAAPIFLYFVMESLRRTKNRKKNLIRLYCAAVCTGLCNIGVSVLLGATITFGNIYMSYVWAVGIALFLDDVIGKLQNKSYIGAVRIILFAICGLCTITFLDTCLINYYELSMMLNLDIAFCRQLHNVFRAFLCPPLSVEYSLLFIVLGVTWYFVKSKIHRCMILVAFGILGFLGIGSLHPVLNFIAGNQWVMIGSVIPIAMYNGEYGRGYKTFFYIYYPVHCYVIAFFANIYI